MRVGDELGAKALQPSSPDASWMCDGRECWTSFVVTRAMTPSYQPAFNATPTVPVSAT
jgi:hypothetical protein